MPHNVNGALYVLALSNLPHVQILCRERVAVLRQSGHPDLTHTETETATDRYRAKWAKEKDEHNTPNPTYTPTAREGIHPDGALHLATLEVESCCRRKGRHISKWRSTGKRSTGKMGSHKARRKTT